MKIISLLILLSVSCSPTVSNKSTDITSGQNKQNTMQQEKNTKVTTPLEHTLKEALIKYGKPTSREKFKLNNNLSEFRIELLNNYTQEEIGSNNIEIEEITWSKDKDNNITIWYQKGMKHSIAKHYLIWDKEAEF